MSRKPYLAALVLAASLGAASGAHAQLGDALKGAVGGGGGGSPLGGGLGSLGGGGLPSLDSVGTGNLTGVLGYCMKNKYLGGSDASGVQNQLLGKLGGASKAQADPGYREGLSGVLGGNSGQKTQLGSGGLKGELTSKACDQVLKYGQSLI